MVDVMGAGWFLVGLAACAVVCAVLYRVGLAIWNRHRNTAHERQAKQVERARRSASAPTPGTRWAPTPEPERQRRPRKTDGPRRPQAWRGEDGYAPPAAVAAVAAIAAAAIAAGPAAGQENPGEDGRFDLRSYVENFGVREDTPPEPEVIEAIPDRAEYDEQAARLTELEAEYDAEYEAWQSNRDKAQEEGLMSEAGGQYEDASEQAQGRYETARDQAGPIVDDMREMEAEGAAALEAQAEAEDEAQAQPQEQERDVVAEQIYGDDGQPDSGDEGGSFLRPLLYALGALAILAVALRVIWSGITAPIRRFLGR